ncbi:Pheromone shutdown [Parasponia andersonii]|uniref:Pheromone shutdown n=1 Tax=Parasponia andersonii TaxID=3476 RepID=A0A2P5D634_PARAD|nr:Pheromone shutdown [Parasponia andersonii]
MNRLTRLATRFNSPESKLLFTRLPYQSNAARFSPPLSLRQFSTGPPTRKVLPEELLSNNLVELTCESSAKGGLCHVYLLGTAHDSKESCREVEAVISYLKPQVVFLELCGSRVELLDPQNLKAAKDSGINIQDCEFRLAYEEAIKYGGKVILGDRPMEFKERLDDVEVEIWALMTEEIRKRVPTVVETLIDERDQYMSFGLLNVASMHSSIVAVVGKGHLQGIKKHWKQPVVLKDLLEIPSQKAAVSKSKLPTDSLELALLKYNDLYVDMLGEHSQKFRMNRLTRLATRFNSPESHRLLNTTTTSSTDALRRSAVISVTRRNFAFTPSSITGGHRRSDPLRPAMDSQSPPEIDASEGEDFVRIEGATAEDLSESIVRVDEPRESIAAAPTEEDSARRSVLPEELSRSLVMLTCESSAEGGVCDVYLVGTAHVSTESCREVEAVISYLKPEVVYLELCATRVAVLTPQNLKVANKLEVFPGSEFRVAYEEAMKYGGRVILGDRPVQIKEMDDVDMLTLVVQEMSKEFPTLMETLVHERDRYMSSTLLRIASEHSSVVAVVGKGHLQGIRKHWQQPVMVKDLMELPTQNAVVSGASILKSLGVVAVGAAIISGIYLASKK